MKSTYEIGGVAVQMTAKQAGRWNSGETTDDDLRRVEVCIPDVWQVCADGNSGRLLKPARRISLQEALADSQLSSMMDSMSANVMR